MADDVIIDILMKMQDFNYEDINECVQNYFQLQEINQSGWFKRIDADILFDASIVSTLCRCFYPSNFKTDQEQDQRDDIEERAYTGTVKLQPMHTSLFTAAIDSLHVISRKGRHIATQIPIQMISSSSSSSSSMSDHSPLDSFVKAIQLLSNDPDTMKHARRGIDIIQRGISSTSALSIIECLSTIEGHLKDEAANMIADIASNHSESLKYASPMLISRLLDAALKGKGAGLLKLASSQHDLITMLDRAAESANASQRSAALFPDMLEHVLNNNDQSIAPDALWCLSRWACIDPTTLLRGVKQLVLKYPTPAVRRLLLACLSIALRCECTTDVKSRDSSSLISVCGLIIEAFGPGLVFSPKFERNAHLSDSVVDDLILAFDPQCNRSSSSHEIRLASLCVLLELVQKHHYSWEDCDSTLPGVIQHFWRALLMFERLGVSRLEKIGSKLRSTVDVSQPHISGVDQPLIAGFRLENVPSLISEAAIAAEILVKISGVIPPIYRPMFPFPASALHKWGISKADMSLCQVLIHPGVSGIKLALGHCFNAVKHLQSQLTTDFQLHGLKTTDEVSIHTPLSWVGQPSSHDIEHIESLLINPDVSIWDLVTSGVISQLLVSEHNEINMISNSAVWNLNSKLGLALELLIPLFPHPTPISIPADRFKRSTAKLSNSTGTYGVDIDIGFGLMKPVFELTEQMDIDFKSQSKDIDASTVVSFGTRIVSRQHTIPSISLLGNSSGCSGSKLFTCAGQADIPIRSGSRHSDKPRTRFSDDLPGLIGLKLRVSKAITPGSSKKRHFIGDCDDDDTDADQQQCGVGKHRSVVPGPWSALLLTGIRASRQPCLMGSIPHQLTTIVTKQQQQCQPTPVLSTIRPIRFLTAGLIALRGTLYSRQSKQPESWNTPDLPTKFTLDALDRVAQRALDCSTVKCSSLAPVWLSTLLVVHPELVSSAFRYRALTLASVTPSRAALLLGHEGYLTETEPQSLELHRTAVSIDRSVRSLVSYLTPIVYGPLEPMLTFSDEPGNGNGVTRGAFSWVAGLFENDTDMKWVKSSGRYLSPCLSTPVSKMEMIGELCAFAFVFRLAFPLPLHPLFRTVLNNSIRIVDEHHVFAKEAFNSIYPEFASSINQMSKFVEDGVEIEDFYVPALLPGETEAEGEEAPLLTSATFDAFVKRALTELVICPFTVAVKSFLRGWNRHCRSTPPTLLSDWDFVLGSDCFEWSSDTMLASCQLRGWNQDSDPATPIWFCQWVCSLTTDQKRVFLRWLTGSPGLPVGGWSCLVPRLCILKLDDLSRYPVAQTCFHLLKLPAYSSYEVLVQKMEAAIVMSGNQFGLA
eukprot:gnl/Dysnectes_brevis/5691_a8328_422.p1 GENE.gnl/Dysnectes_brevis/5691_a8328_422~~gnl/Dysnectes_brevis/5691_a8328_422.p1  ORF type:complete len:1327 (-),score=103.29 gnl/Dysnectes_brevis/5691_a8328_422:58-4038(-)